MLTKVAIAMGNEETLRKIYSGEHRIEWEKRAAELEEQRVREQSEKAKAHLEFEAELKAICERREKRREARAAFWADTRLGNNHLGQGHSGNHTFTCNISVGSSSRFRSSTSDWYKYDVLRIV